MGEIDAGDVELLGLVAKVESDGEELEDQVDLFGRELSKADLVATVTSNGLGVWNGPNGPCTGRRRSRGLRTGARARD